jgi:hypothetical protein
MIIVVLTFGFILIIIIKIGGVIIPKKKTVLTLSFSILMALMCIMWSLSSMYLWKSWSFATYDQYVFNMFEE